MEVSFQGGYSLKLRVEGRSRVITAQHFRPISSTLQLDLITDIWVLTSRMMSQYHCYPTELFQHYPCADREAVRLRRTLPVRFLRALSIVLALSLIIDVLGRIPIGNDFPHRNTYYLPKWEMAGTPSYASRLVIAREWSLPEPEAAIMNHLYPATLIYGIVLIDIW